MENEEKNLRLKAGMKKYTSTEIAERMSYWMKHSPVELDEAADDPSLSILDHICVSALLKDWKYGTLKNLDVMLSRIIGTPVNQTILQNKVEMQNPVHIDLIGVEVGDEDSLKALEDLRTPPEVAADAVGEASGTD